jgi:hypothetical protein
MHCLGDICSEVVTVDVVNSSIKTQSNGAFHVTTGTSYTKPRPADWQVAAFRPRIIS